MTNVQITAIKEATVAILKTLVKGDERFTQKLKKADLIDLAFTKHAETAGITTLCECDHEEYSIKFVKSDILLEDLVVCLGCGHFCPEDEIGIIPRNDEPEIPEIVEEEKPEGCKCGLYDGDVCEICRNLNNSDPLPSLSMPKCSMCDERVEAITDSLCPSCKEKVGSEPHVICASCERHVPKASCLKVGDQWLCEDDAGCTETMKDKAKKKTIASTEKAAEKKAAKKNSQGKPRAKASANDAFPLTALENKRHQKSVRYQIWEFVNANENATIQLIHNSLEIELPVVRDCVKKMIADGKMLMDTTPAETPEVEESKEA